MIRIDFIKEQPNEDIEISYRNKEDSVSAVEVVHRDRLYKKIRFGGQRDVDYGQYSGLSNLSFSYKVTQTSLITNLHGTLFIFPKSPLIEIIAELFFLIRIVFNWNIPRAYGALKERKLLKVIAIPLEAIVTVPYAIILRLTHRMTSLRNKTIWLVSDRNMAARDNGEAFFRYAQTVKDDNLDIYFVVQEKSPDYTRLQKIGPVISSGSFKHKLLLLLSSKLISSHADIETTNPFFRTRDRFADLLSFDFIFLQHGVIRHDHSKWLNKYEKNIKLFITSAQKEYDSILSFPYHYTEEEVLLSGLPRFDYLESKVKKRVIIAPTYRAGLLTKKTNKNGVRSYDSSFRKSNYFKFYDNLINNERLKEALGRNGYKVDFLIHPNFEQQRGDFRVNKYVTIPKYPYNYTKYISEGSLLVSDYSSIAVDFAYLLKPVIYAKFDEDSFYKTHSYGKSVFFHDETDGFGVIVKDEERLIDEIIRNIENNCRMEDQYRKRVKDFFYRIDKHNSKRVYDAIIRL